MALVKCNHCRKETKNVTGKCRWCNKELEKHLDNIEREINSIVKKHPLESKDNFNWICDECNEENEPIYDVCWNCSTESEIAKTKYKEFSKEEVKKEKKEAEGKLIHQEINELEMLTVTSMKKYIWISRVIAFLSVIISATIVYWIIEKINVIPNDFSFGLFANALLSFAYIGSLTLFGIFIYSKLYHKYRDKMIKEQDEIKTQLDKLSDKIDAL